MYLFDGPSGAVTLDAAGRYWYSGIPFAAIEEVRAAIARQRDMMPITG